MNIQILKSFISDMNINYANVLKTRIDDDGVNYVYKGVALPWTKEDESKWQIIRIDSNWNIDHAEWTDEFKFKWTDHLTLNYK